MNAAKEGADKLRLDLAERLRESREYLGLSQDDAALALGISRPAITLIESGGRKVEAVELGKLATLYGKSTQWLLSGKESAEEAKLAFLARAIHGLSEADLDQLERFGDYLRNSAKSKKRGSNDSEH